MLAFIASLNDSCTRYFSDVVFHRSGEEISRGTAVKECMTNALKMYHEVNKVGEGFGVWGMEYGVTGYRIRGYRV